MENDKYLLNQNLEAKLIELPKILQIILQTEGTITIILSTWLGEKVIVEKLIERNSKIYKVSDPNEYNFDKDSLLDERTILVKGSNNRPYTMAVSAVYHEHLPGYLQQKMHNTNIGVGELLRIEKIPAFREIEKVEFLPVSDVKIFSTYFPDEKYAILHRRYSIYIGMKLTQKIMTINSYWPASIKL
jgi:chorismate-pyruvate lyase